MIKTENQNAPATQKQTWAIFVRTGYDVRSCGLTMSQASEIIGGAKSPSEFPGARQVRRVAAKQDWQAIYNEAHESGMRAGQACNPVPMVVVQRENPLNDNSPITKTYAPVMDGVCGFSSSVIKPANCSFVKWLKLKCLGHSSHYGGWAIPCHAFNQSLTRKEAYTDEFCRVLNKYGINAHSESRID